MEKRKPQRAEETGADAANRPPVESYLNHGVESLVALDNPDDSKLGAEGEDGED